MTDSHATSSSMLESSRYARLLFGAVQGVLITAFAVACGLSTLTYEWLKAQLDEYSGDGSADAFTLEIYQNLRLALWWTLMATAAAVAINQFNRSWLLKFFTHRLHDAKFNWAELRSLISPMTKGWCIPVSLVITTAFASTAAVFLDEPIRYDEAHTYLNYVAPPLFITISRYDAPNNHVLHSLAAKLSCSVFGDSVIALRLPAFAAACGLVFTISVIGWLFVHPAFGIGAALIVAANPTLVESASNARGHVLAALLLMKAGLMVECSYRSRKPFWPLVLLVFYLSLALYTVPTAIYGIFFLSVWGASRSLLTTGSNDNAALRIRRYSWNFWNAKSYIDLAFIAKLALAVLAGVVLALVLYLPIILANKRGQVSGVVAADRAAVSETLQALPGYVVDLWNYFQWEVHWSLQVVYLFAIAACLLVGLSSAALPRITKGSRDTAAICLATFGSLLAVAALILWHGTLPPVRVLFFLLPVFSALVAQGLFFLSAICFSQRVGHWLSTAAAIAIYTCLTYQTLTTEAIHTSNRHATVREAQAVAVWLRNHASPGQPIIAVTPESAPVVYFFQKYDWPLDHFFVPGQGKTDDSSALLLTNDGFQQTPASVLRELKLETMFHIESATELIKLDQTRVWQLNKSGL